MDLARDVHRLPGLLKAALLFKFGKIHARLLLSLTVLWVGAQMQTVRDLTSPASGNDNRRLHSHFNDNTGAGFMGGPIVRTGTTPAFWQNWDKAFAKGAGKSKKGAAAKSAATKPAKSAKSKPAGKVKKKKK
jgi:hypothetical protein